MEFLLTCIYVMLIFIRPQDWVPQLRGVAVVNWAAITALAILAAYHLATGGRKLWRQPQVIYFALFWLSMQMSWAAKFHLQQSHHTILFMLPLAIPFFLLACTTTNRQRFDILTYVLWGSLLVLAVHCLMQYTHGAGFAGRTPIRYAGGRIGVMGFGIFGGPNETANLLGVGLVMSLALASRFRRLVPLAGIMLAAAGLFGFTLWHTNSRQSILFAAFGIYALFVKLKATRELVAAILALTVLMGGIQLSARWAGGITGDSTVRFRAMLITGGLRVWRNNKVFGVGRGRSYYATGYSRPLHNSYLQVLAENGFGGLAAFLGMLVVSGLQLLYIVRCIPEDKREKHDVGRARMMLAMIATAGASVYFINSAYKIDLLLYIAMASSLGAIMQDSYGDWLPGYFRGEWIVRWGLLVMFLATCGMILTLHLTSKIFWRLA